MKTTDLIPFLSLAVMIALANGCSDDTGQPDGANTPPEGANTVVSSLDRDLNPAPTPDELRALTDGNHDLTIDLYTRSRSGNDNYMISTLSIRTAFAMVYAGARGTTAAEMSTVLRFDADQGRLHQAMNALDLALQSRQLEPDLDNMLDPVELRQANAFWGQTNYPWLGDYLDTLAVNYGAGIMALDFRTAPEPSRLEINAWVESRTNDRIRNLLPPNSIKANTVAVLTNAIYFRAPWLTPFGPESTAPSTFNLIDATTTSAEFMSQVAELRYAAVNGMTAVELPYRGGELSMVLLIPDSNVFEQIDQNLTSQVIASTIEALQPSVVELKLPKFEFETGFTLSETLRDLGMTSAFSPGADLSGMVEGGGLRVDEAYHRTFVAVDEEGTEAAAATAVVIVERGAPVPDVTVEADRPFYFLIRDRETDVWLFFGRVMDPTE